VKKFVFYFLIIAGAALLVFFLDGGVVADQGLPKTVPPQSAKLSTITVDYPSEGSLFPPDIAPPTFLWRDADDSSKLWEIEVTFADRSANLKLKSQGECLQIGEIDQLCAKAGAVPPTLTPNETTGHSWKPDPATWETIKKHTANRKATITFTGFRDEKMEQAISRGQVTIQTSKDPVGAPIFFRDVPLISVPVGEKGLIMPLPADAIPLIAWRLRYIQQEKSQLMMQGLPTCANCHSASRDGKTLGLDVDGPQNDKGLYAIVPLQKVTSIRNENVIKWSAFAEERATKRYGFMSQISPDGKYVVNSIEYPGARMKKFADRFFNGFYKDYGFGQVFYPTKGVLGWYSRESGKLSPLPGADDPQYVQACAFWSPDSRYLIFSRAKAREPYPEGQPIARFANDPNETQIQYDLYRIPFNDGKGGKAEPIEGAADNGMSNNFPKVSPDGRWIVFVQNKNGLLMRPDSQLYIVPVKGGKARRLNCNTSRMNSWHSFSPNGRWLVFSSKGRSLYTQMYLTHLDENGNDSPAILIENATAANRGVNIPEFLNIPPDGMTRIDTPVEDYFRQYNVAAELMGKNQYIPAIEQWKKALEMDPEDPKARYNLASCLHTTGQFDDAIVQYQKSLEYNAENSLALTNIGVLLADKGNLDEAIESFKKALVVKPNNANAHNNLGLALAEKGQTDAAIEHFKKAIEIDPEYAEAQNGLGFALAKKGALAEGLSHLEKAVATNPASIEYQYNLGRLLAAQRRFLEAIPHFEQAVLLSDKRDPQILDMLAAMYFETGRYLDAVQTERQAYYIARQQNNRDFTALLNARVAAYESKAAAQSKP
jgi:tetratricopeptide (TPR) repeat protein